MGLPAPIIELFAQIHTAKKITGSVGFIARQTTYATSNTLRDIAERYSISEMHHPKIELDNETLAVRQRGELLFGKKVQTITDRCLMKSFGCDKLNFIDHSDYENADVICDLNYPIDEELKGKFDFIYNGSCLDNVFNVGVGLSNISSLLRPGGRVVMLEHCSNMNGPYLMFSPGWFNDFFSANNYADCKVYIARVKNNEDLHYGPWELWYYDYLIRPDGNTPGQSLFPYLKTFIKNRLGIPIHIKERDLVCIVVAEKGKDSTDEVMPNQAQYRSDSESKRLRLIQENWASKKTDICPSLSSSFCLPKRLPRGFVRCNDLGNGLTF